MLLQILKKLTGRALPKRQAAQPDAALLERAHALAMRDNRTAIKAYRKYLETAPTNVMALNGLGACLADIGDTAQATATFELAHSLDDTFVPAMVNHAKLLNDNHRGGEALAYLTRCKTVSPHFLHADAVYAGILFKRGDTPRARGFQLKSSLANFDNLRLANCYLFWTAYDDVSERLVAAEHRFWAETVAIPSLEDDIETGDGDSADEGGDSAQPYVPSDAPPGQRRIRIGYWSPDLRSHSVRFFFRPLLEAHDRDRFEVILYHDFPKRDSHTDAMAQRCDHFVDVFDKTDAQLVRLIRSHDLDVLVELAGHTSNNRISLLHHRMARVQLTGLGYPLTTGLSTVDGKLLDPLASTPNDRHYYAEKPVVLPTSFWCFDPWEDVPVATEPPVDRNGFVTFGCVGNVAKITPVVLRAWVDILAQVDGSRLAIRSISFLDQDAIDAVRARFTDFGLPMDRVDFLPPSGGLEFFTSYDQIDIILDTFPFNGGTTTCFAAYMGVPVVGRCGDSLLGRMGRSVMGNLGEGHLAVDSMEQYVPAAVAAARDLEWLRRFKREARSRFERNALGNGELFAREFEQACLDLLAQQGNGTLRWEHAIDLLPPNEIMRRAYAVLRSGQEDASRRIVDYCLRHYPDYGPAHLLRAQERASAGSFQDAIAYLEERMPGFSQADRVSALIFNVRQRLLMGERKAAGELVANLRSEPIADPFDALQLQLYEAALREHAAPAARPAGPARRVRIVIPCDSASQFRHLQDHLGTLACPEGTTVDYLRCDEKARIAAYVDALQSGADAVLLVQKNVRILNAAFLSDVLSALDGADVVGISGATRWHRMDWRLDAFDAKAGALIGPSSEQPGQHEVQVFGPPRDPLVRGMAILDGTLLAINARASFPDAWDEDCLGCLTLLEETWSHEVGRAGLRLAVCGGLGVAVDPSVQLDGANHAEARVHCAERWGFDPFGPLSDDHLALSVPVPGGPEAAAVCRAYFGLS